MLNHLSIPAACFTHPEISMVGLTEVNLRTCQMLSFFFAMMQLVCSSASQHVGILSLVVYSVDLSFIFSFCKHQVSIRGNRLCMHFLVLPFSCMSMAILFSIVLPHPPVLLDHAMVLTVEVIQI